MASDIWQALLDGGSLMRAANAAAADAAADAADDGAAATVKAGQYRLSVSKSVLKAPMIPALETGSS